MPQSIFHMASAIFHREAISLARQGKFHWKSDKLWLVAFSWRARRDYLKVSLRLTKFHHLWLEILKSPVYSRVSLRLTKFHRLWLENLKSPVYSRVSLRLTKFHRPRLEILKSPVSNGRILTAGTRNKNNHQMVAIFIWRARRDSNALPYAPKAYALSEWATGACLDMITFWII